MEKLQKVILWVWDNISNIDALVAVIMVIVSIAVIVSGMVAGFLRLKLKHNRYKYLNIPIDRVTKQSMRYYVPTRGQKTDPSAGEEDAGNDSFNLTNLFLKEIFSKSDEQYFIILADSGMGKTTFLLNLFLEYYKKIFRKYNIVLIPLAFENAVEKINEIEDKAATILLLDGLDEDKYAMDDYVNRLKEICDASESFYKVIVTCRTQFFPDSKSEPRKTDKTRYGIGKKSIEFVKYYISPFNEQEVELYLKKKYKGLFTESKINRSKKIIMNCPDLMMRPMLLGYIDDLLADETKEYSTAYEIYSELVRRWIEREPVDDKKLYKFSAKIAEKMYNDNTIYISQINIEKLCRKYNIKLKSIEAKSKSLLNRNALGDYKFAHRSILEYFVANSIYHNWTFNNYIAWDRVMQYEMVIRFLKEMGYKELDKLIRGKVSVIKNMFFAFCEYPNADFSHKTISCCEFIDCDFDGADFSGTTFIDVRLNKVKFRYAQLTSVDFSNAELNDVDFENADLWYAKLNNLILTNTKLKNADLSKAELKYTDLTNTNLEGAKLKDADLRYANLEGANLKGVNLAHTILIMANMKQTKLRGAVLNTNQVIYLNTDVSGCVVYIEETDEFVPLEKYYKN